MSKIQHYKPSGIIVPLQGQFKPNHTSEDSNMFNPQWSTFRLVRKEHMERRADECHGQNTETKLKREEKEEQNWRGRFWEAVGRGWFIHSSISRGFRYVAADEAEKPKHPFCSNQWLVCWSTSWGIQLLHRDHFCPWIICVNRARNKSKLSRAGHRLTLAC